MNFRSVFIAEPMAGVLLTRLKAAILTCAKPTPDSVMGWSMALTYHVECLLRFFRVRGFDCFSDLPDRR